MKKLLTLPACAICLLVLGISDTARADVVLQHLGGLDPGSEGFVVDPGMSDGTASAVDDGGVPAWHISGIGTAYRYNNVLGVTLVSDMQTQGWYLDWKVRDALSTDWASKGNVYMEVSNASHTYHMSVGPEDGNLYLYQGNGGFGVWNQVYSETGTGTNWHTYRLVVDAGGSATAPARFYVDGNHVQDISPLEFPYAPEGRIVWGDTERGDSTNICDANWAEVTLALGAPVVEPVALPKHVGSTDPTGGRFLNDGAAGSAVIDDLGVEAWNINQPVSRYRALLVSDELDAMAAEGWTATMTARNLLANDAVDWGVHLEVSDRTHTYLLDVGSDELGNPTLYYLTNLSDYTKEAISLTGISGAGYHTYEMAYSPTNPGTVNVIVDDILQATISGADNTVETGWSRRMCFGSTDAFAVADANYSLVELTLGSTLPLVPGDANGDTFVDNLDASILGAHWLKTGGATWEQGDFNRDGNVNDKDAAILAAHWTASAGGEESVPEPSTLALLLGAVAGLLIGRARHHGGWR
jgi:hypothetical protein